MNRQLHNRIWRCTIAAMAFSACSSGTETHTNNAPKATDVASAATVVAAPGTTAAQVDKAGNPTASGPSTLTLAWFGSEGQASGQLATLFADEVKRASGGQVTVEIQYQVADAWQEYADGKFDLLLSPARALDTLGVHSFDALTLPFVVNDDDQADRVVESASAKKMLDGLSAIDSTGVAFAPVDERHLVVQGDEPLRSLDQIGGKIRVSAVGQLNDEMFKSLGYTPVHDLNGDDWAAAVADGSVPTAWTSTQLSGGVPGSPRMASDFSLGYEFNVLLAHNDVLDALGAGRADAVRAAGGTAQQRAIDERAREADAFRDACATGAELRATPMPLISEIGRKLAPFVLNTINADPDTKALYQALNRTAGVHERTWPAECRNRTVAPYEAPTPPSTSFPEGTYRSTPLPSGGFLAAGVGNDTAASNDWVDYGEMRFGNGAWTLDLYGRAGKHEHTCESTYTVDTTGVVDLAPGGNCGPMTFTWSTASDGIIMEMLSTGEQYSAVDDWDMTMTYAGHLIKVG